MKNFGGRLLLVAAGLLLPLRAGAHCDTMDGPVVREAKTAIQAGDITTVLKWVGKKDEPELRQAFDRTLAVRKKGKDARELADTYFFETLVRLHRAGEGEPYTGLKPAGIHDPAYAAADAALSTGSAEELIRQISAELAEGIRERFAEALAKKRDAGVAVEAGRDYVRAYVTFLHYVEELQRGLSAGPVHGLEPGAHEGPDLPEHP